MTEIDIDGFHIAIFPYRQDWFTVELWRNDKLMYASQYKSKLDALQMASAMGSHILEQEKEQTNG
jgi:hypothetical protein